MVKKALKREQLTVRLPKDLLGRIARVREFQSKATKLDIPTAITVRGLLERGLAILEKELQDDT
jgi:hypothetical protein